MLAVIAIVLTIQTPPPMPAAPAETRYVGGASFADNDYRRMVAESARQIRERQREVDRRNREAAHRLMQRERLALADRLDPLIASGQCDAARREAEASGWSDIAGEVTRVCAVRAGGQDPAGL